MSSSEVHVIFCDGEVFVIYKNRETAEHYLGNFIYNDKDQEHTWSLTSFDLIDD